MNIPGEALSGKAMRVADRHRSPVVSIRRPAGRIGPSCTCLILAIAAGTAAAGEVKCFSERKFDGEGLLQMSVNMDVKQGKLRAIELSHLTLVYSTKTGYQCDARLTDGEPSNNWQISGDRTEINSAGDAPEESSRLVVERTARGYRLDTRRLSTADCGVRGQWPASVFVPAAGGRCRTKYE